MTDGFTTDPIADVVAAIRMVGPEALAKIFLSTSTGPEFGEACAAKGDAFPWDVISRTRRATAHRIAFGIARRELGISGRAARDAIHTVGGHREVLHVLQGTSAEGWMVAALEQSEIDAQCDNTAEAAAWKLLAETPVNGVTTLLAEFATGLIIGGEDES
jgi:hypothetical protein